MTPRKRASLVAAAALVLGAALAGSWATGQPRPRRDTGYHAIQIPRAPAPEKERRVLLRTPHLEVEALSLPRGSNAEPHRDPSAMMLLALSGSGKVTVSGNDEILDLEHAVYLAPGVEHVVTAGEREDLLLLVQRPVAGTGKLRRDPP